MREPRTNNNDEDCPTRCADGRDAEMETTRRRTGILPPGEDTDEKIARPRWSRWYADARADMEFRYGLRRIPVDFYKTQYALGDTPEQAAKNIYNWMQATDRPRQR